MAAHTKTELNYVKVTYSDGRTEWVRFKNEKAAENAAEAMKGMDAGGTITIGDFFDRWMKYHVISVLKKDTAQEYGRNMATKTLPYLGKKKLSELTKGDIERFISKLQKEGHSNRRIGTILTVLSAMLGTAVKWHYLKANPFDGLDILMLSARPE